jgi:hypothetical protein
MELHLKALRVMVNLYLCTSDAQREIKVSAYRNVASKIPPEARSDIPNNLRENGVRLGGSL